MGHYIWSKAPTPVDQQQQLQLNTLHSKVVRVSTTSMVLLLARLSPGPVVVVNTQLSMAQLSLVPHSDAHLTQLLRRITSTPRSRTSQVKW
jgi:hypothetical protein